MTWKRKTRRLVRQKAWKASTKWTTEFENSKTWNNQQQTNTTETPIVIIETRQSTDEDKKIKQKQFSDNMS